MQLTQIPHNFDTWHYCITVECGLELTTTFIQQRIADLENLNDFRTQQFISCYGETHRKNVLGWFKQAENAA